MRGLQPGIRIDLFKFTSIFIPTDSDTFSKIFVESRTKSYYTFYRKDLILWRDSDAIFL